MSFYENEYERKRQMAFSDEILKRGKKKKSPANQLTTDIIKWVVLTGGAARRVNSQGQYDEATGRWRSSGMRRGFEDIDCCMPISLHHNKYGIKVAVEVKIGKDKLSEYQIARKEELFRAGGYYIVASSFDQFKKDWIELSDKIEKEICSLYQKK